MTSPTEKHREITELIIDQCEGCSCDVCIGNVERIIDRALANAKREGMKRAAEIAQGASGEFDFQEALAECRDTEFGFHKGRIAAADLILSEIILSEAGEG